MRFEPKGHHTVRRPLSLAEAVAWECGPSILTDGQIERAAEAAENTGKLLGQLFEALVERGVIRVEEVEGMIGWTRVGYHPEES